MKELTNAFSSIGESISTSYPYVITTALGITIIAYLLTKKHQKKTLVIEEDLPKEITPITREVFRELLNGNWEHSKGLYFIHYVDRNGAHIYGVDNQSSTMQVESFDTQSECVNWLMRNYEDGNYILFI